jgi:hypothetical protein
MDRAVFGVRGIHSHSTDGVDGTAKFPAIGGSAMMRGLRVVISRLR